MAQCYGRCILAVVVGASIITLSVIEEPARRAIRRRFGGTPLGREKSDTHGVAVPLR